jgi:hypothetical protein
MARFEVKAASIAGPRADELAPASQAHLNPAVARRAPQPAHAPTDWLVAPEAAAILAHRPTDSRQVSDTEADTLWNPSKHARYRPWLGSLPLFCRRPDEEAS